MAVSRSFSTVAIGSLFGEACFIRLDIIIKETLETVRYYREG